MASPRFFWTVTVAVIPLVSAPAALAQTSGGMRPSELGRNGPPAGHVTEPAPTKPSRRGRSRTDQPHEDPPPATNDWNPHYLKGKAHFIEGHYAEALTELEQNVADCDQIDFESMRRQNGYFDHIWNNVSSMGLRPHDFIRASNLQWVAATLAAQGHYESAEARFGEMATYAEKCFPGRYSTFKGCACQGLAFLLAARGRYNQAAERYRLALAHIEGNEAQIGLPPAPCVAMILVALADVELARGRPAAAQQYLRRADRVQEAQRALRLGPAPLDRAAYLTVFAQLRQCQLRDSEAYDGYAEAMEVIEAIEKKHPLAAFCLDGLAELDLERGRLDQSESHFRQSLVIRQAALGESHRDVAYSLDGLARVAAARGKSEKAESLLRDASAILTRELGSAHPDLIAVTAHLRRLNRPVVPSPEAVPPRGRFLAIPTLLTVGWQVLHIGKDWRIVESNLRKRDAREARAALHVQAKPAVATDPNRR